MALKVFRERAGLTVQEEVDVVLAIVCDVLGAMLLQAREAEGGEEGVQPVGLGAGELDELDAVETNRVVGTQWITSAWESDRGRFKDTWAV